jgi:hypothetical protein
VVENSAIHNPIFVCQSNYKFCGVGHRAEPSLILHHDLGQKVICNATLVFLFDNFYGEGVQEMRIGIVQGDSFV